jgi:hypothetical protein
MFGTANQSATIDGFNVRVKDERERDRNHIIEATFGVLLTHDLADEIMPQMARDLFQQVKGDWIPKPEMTGAEFALQPKTQILTIRQHPEMEAVFRVQGVTLRRISVYKAEGGQWMLQFTASWVLGVDVEAVALIRGLKTAVYLTLEEQQPDMLDPGQAPDAGTTATVDQSGNVESIRSGRRKRGARGAAAGGDNPDVKPEAGGDEPAADPSVN